VQGFFKIGSRGTICLHWLRTMILLISASWVASITGVIHWGALKTYGKRGTWWFSFNNRSWGGAWVIPSPGEGGPWARACSIWDVILRHLSSMSPKLTLTLAHLKGKGGR
jgi:hypothetical protein